MIPKTSQCLVQIDAVAISSAARISMEIKHDRILSLAQDFLEQIFLVLTIVNVEITRHHLLDDLVAVLSWIIAVICIIMNIICYIFECLGAELQLLVESFGYVIWHDVPCCDGDFLVVIIVVVSQTELSRSVESQRLWPRQIQIRWIGNFKVAENGNGEWRQRKISFIFCDILSLFLFPERRGNV